MRGMSTPAARDASALVEAALAAGLGSAAALSIGDGGVERVRQVWGTTRRVPDLGPAIAADTPFDLASLTKPMATVAIAMALVGEGRLALDAPVRRWLPAATTGTVAALLGHAAGTAAHLELYRDPSVVGAVDPRAEVIARATAHPAGPPGEASVYSDLGFLMLGAIVERCADARLDEAFATWVADPLGLTGAGYPGRTPWPAAVATELDDTSGVAPAGSSGPARGRGLVCGVVHDENAYVAGGVCGHAGLFAPIGDVGRFAAAITACAGGAPRGRWRPELVRRFLDTAPAPGVSWRLGWDTPSTAPGVSHAGDRWPRVGGWGHTGFTGTSMWIDVPRQRWVVLLTNRVHPTRQGTADAIKALRRAVGDAVATLGDH